MNTGNTETGRKPSQLHPLTLIGAIFSGLGLLFAVLGGAFLGANAPLLPRVFSAEALGDNVPDELALPLVGLIFAAIGLFFLITGVVMLLVTRRQRLLRQELEQYGTRVSGTVTDIRLDQTYRVNGRHPLRIFVQVAHPTTGETLTVRSGPVWETSLATGDMVDVLFDPMDEKKHIVVLPD